MTIRRALSVDPGTGKCGVAVVEAPATVLWRGITGRTDLARQMQELLAEFQPDCILVGNGTGSRDVIGKIEAFAGELPVIPVPEKHSSERARARCRLERPASGWQRLLPRALRAPEQPYDDLVAVILAEEYFASKSAGRLSQP